MTKHPLEILDPVRIHVRWMIRRDMDEVLAMEAETARPWREQRILRCLRDRYTIGMVAESGDKVVGWMLFELNRDFIRVRRLVVLSSQRRRSIGRQLLTKVRNKLFEHRRTFLRTLVDEDNLPALGFLQACGFRAVATKRNTHTIQDEAGIPMVRDSYRLEYHLPQGE